MGVAFLKSLSFGALIAASIGPIAMLIISTAASRGLRSGFFAGLGAAFGDLVYALLVFSVGALLLPVVAGHMTGIRIGSALVLIGFAVALIQRDMVGAAARPALAPRAASALLPTFLLTLVNPLTLVLFAGFVPQLPLAGSLVAAGWLAFGLFCGSLLVQLALAMSGWLLGLTLPGRGWRRAVNLGGAAGILAYGVAGLYSAL